MKDSSILTNEKLEKLLNDGEGFTVEFKKCKDTLPASVFETVCSFSNRYGGFILLGVDDSGKVLGVEPSAVQKIKKDFINTLNNPNKIRPSLFLNLEEYEYEEKRILWVYVPVNSDVEFCDGKVFDRNGEADQDITKSVDLVANLYNRKSHDFYERTLFPYATLDHLRLDLIPKVKQLVQIKNILHPWKDMDAMEIFKSAGLYEDNLITGKKGFNLAAILLFGKDTAIQSCLPAYKTDGIFRDKNPDRYDDRLIVETNLIESYERLMGFVQKHTDDRFFLIDNLATSVRDKIAREVVVNTLVHREYSSAYPAKLIITRDKLYTENWNRSTKFGRLTPDNFTPYPKNPIIAKFFMELGMADTLGSGVRNLYKFSKIYSGTEPILEEGDVFKTTVLLDDVQKKKNREVDGEINGDTFTENTETSQKIIKTVEKNCGENPNTVEKNCGESSDTVKKLLSAMCENPFVTQQQLMQITGLSRRGVEWQLKHLKEKNIIRRVGADKGGHWEIIQATENGDK